MEINGYVIQAFDRHYYGLAEPTGVRWTIYKDQALIFELPESAQSVIDTCRYNAKVIEL